MNGGNVLITGGTGSFGKEALKQILTSYRVNKLVVYSRDEFKQYLLQEEWPAKQYPIHFVIGDIRDRDRLWRAMDGMQYVIHAAALKQVPACEDNPIEAIKTNVLGSQNVVECAIDRNVKKVLALGTDKQVNPINLYGATKLCAEKLFIAADRVGRTRFSVVRYGNVMASRGSVVPYFQELAAQKAVIPITNNAMTRFWIMLPEAATFVLKMMDLMHGGEVFVPKLSALLILDLARAIAGKAGRYKEVGIRPGEKLREILISKDEALNAYDCGQFYIVTNYPADPRWKKVSPDFEYASDTDGNLLSIPMIRRILKDGETR